MGASISDRLIVQLDRGLRVLAGVSRSERIRPDTGLPETQWASEAERIRVGRLMRVNHAGEVCAQALYQGQALTARLASNRKALRLAAQEEIDHLVWCRDRLRELKAYPSALNPVWYTGSWIIGVVAGLAGDQWNLAFLEVTEQKVTQHLAGHLGIIPEHDERSRAIVLQMKIDEEGHAKLAHELGAASLPSWLKLFMDVTSWGMIRLTTWL